MGRSLEEEGMMLKAQKKIDNGTREKVLFWHKTEFVLGVAIQQITCISRKEKKIHGKKIQQVSRYSHGHPAPCSEWFQNSLSSPRYKASCICGCVFMLSPLMCLSTCLPPVLNKATYVDLCKCFLSYNPLSLSPLKKPPGNKHSFRRGKDYKSTSINGL